jgi:hypothetical protein
MGLGSTMTGRQSTFCSPHISRCKADIGYVQSTKNTTASTSVTTSIECCEKEKRYTTRHRDGTHTHDEHLSAKSTSRSRGEGEGEGPSDLLRLPQESRVGGSTGRRTSFVVLEAIPWRARVRRSPAKSARVSTHNDHECELGPTNPSLLHGCVTGRCFNTRSGEEASRGARMRWRGSGPRRRSLLHNGTWKHDLDKPTAASAAARARTHVRTNTYTLATRGSGRTT